MKGRPRTPDEHAACLLPGKTRRIVVKGKVPFLAYVADDGRVRGLLDAMSHHEWRRLMEERAGVAQ